MPDRDTPWTVFLRFLKFGALAWGGPAAQISMIKHECVDELGWTDEETFKKTLAVYQVIPGPEAHQLCVYLGRIRAGKWGGFLAGLGFMLPGLLLMLAISALYVEASMGDRIAELSYGLSPAVAAIVAVAVVRLSRTFITDIPLAIIGAASLALVLGDLLSFIIILPLGGIAYELVRNPPHHRGRANSISPLPLLLIAAAVAVTGTLLAEVFLEGLKAGLLTFGGAFTVIPFLQEAAVNNHGWLTEDQFVDGIAIAGVLPAPLVIFSTFVGYMAAGPAGAMLMTAGIFIPSFTFPILFHRQLVAIANNPRIRPFLLGVAAAVVGLIAGVGIGLIRNAVVDVPTALLAVGALLVLWRWRTNKLTVVAVVVACGLAGIAIESFG